MANAEIVAPIAAARPLPIPLAAFVRRLVSRWALVAVFFAIWEIAPRTGIVDRTFLPPLSEVLADGWRLIGNGQLLTHVEASLSRALFGLLVAVLIGIPLGLVIGWYARLAETVTPLLCRDPRWVDHQGGLRGLADAEARQSAPRKWPTRRYGSPLP